MKALVFLALVLTTALPSAHAAPLAGDPTYKDVKQFLRQLVAKYPQTTQLFQLGISDSGEAIEGVQIGSGATPNLVVATHHGNEYGSTEVARAFAESVASNPIADQTLYVIPVLNTSGYNKRERYEAARGRLHDPNRDYPGPCGTDGPFALKSTKALAQFVADKGIVSSATLHTYYPAVVYPWGLSTHDLSTPYDGLFKQLVDFAAVESGYPTGNSTELIYSADGTYEDYAFWKHGIWSILFELGETHYPDASQIRQMVAVNVPGLRRMFEKAPKARALDHEFKGRCDSRLKILDRRDE